MMFGLFKKQSALDRHFQIVEQMSKEKDESKLISICEEDISLVEDFNREYVRKAEKEADSINLKGARRKNYIALPPSYPSFKKLAIIYERQKRFDEAIIVCQKAISSGYPKDGTDGGMRERIRKLKEKQKKCQEKKSST